MHRTLSYTFALVVALAACGKGSGADAPPPAKPSNGGPISAEFVEFTPGDDGERALKVKLYNHGDKTAVGYVILARFYDGQGTLLKVKPGTPFEDDSSFMSLSGRKYKCEPGKWATLDVEMMEVPAEATRAEVMVSKVDAMSADGTRSEDWWGQDNWSEWPSP